MKTVQVERAQLEQWLQAFKKIHDDKHSHWNVDEEISAIEKALDPIAMEVMKSDEADFWRWWKPYQLKDCWRLELVARDAWMAAKATKQQTEQHARNAITWTPDTGYVFSQPKEPEQEPVGEAYLCDRCQTPFDGAYECPSCGHNEATKEPVYTTLPQRKPLTDDEKENAFLVTTTSDFDPLKNFFDGVAFAEIYYGIKE